MTRLRIAALAAALIAQASPAHAEVVTLVCQDESGDSWRIQVDYDRKTVGFLRPDGSAYFSAAATITEGDVRWDGAVEDKAYHPGQRFEGSLNRFTGQSRVSHPGGGVHLMKRNGMCRRATQKF